MAKKYEKVVARGTDVMKAQLTIDSLKKVEKDYISSIGTYNKELNKVVSHTTQNGVKYTVAQFVENYSQGNLVFTITLDEEKKLAGFYVAKQ